MQDPHVDFNTLFIEKLLTGYVSPTTSFQYVFHWKLLTGYVKPKHIFKTVCIEKPAHWLWDPHLDFNTVYTVHWKKMLTGYVILRGLAAHQG